MTELSRTRPKPPVRALHMGLGSFFRAHQAWYTHHAEDGAEWGYAAFTGRSPRMAEILDLQDALYVLDTRAADGEHFETIESLSAVHAVTDHAAWAAYWSDPAVRLVTLTVTEAGYRRTADGCLDLTNTDVQDDVLSLQSGYPEHVRTAPAQLVAGFMARRAADAGGITIVPCDNLPGNGRALKRVVDELVALAAPALAEWVEVNVDYASTAVDRITPATTEDDQAGIAAATGLDDLSPVITEPFTEWVISGAFPNGRPRWESAGAVFVADTAPYEARKLTLLNGSHSLMAYAGPLRGHTTVNEAIGDDVVRAWVNEWWDEACTHLELPAETLLNYRGALLERYRNPAIQHRLAQIAMDGSLKLPVRIVPTLRAERAAGRLPAGASRAIAAWVLCIRGESVPLADPNADTLIKLSSGTLDQAVEGVLGFLDPELGADGELTSLITELAKQLSRE